VSGLLEVRNLSRRYAVRGGVLGTARRTGTAVEGVDFSVARGGTVGVVGEGLSSPPPGLRGAPVTPEGATPGATTCGAKNRW